MLSNFFLEKGKRWFSGNTLRMADSDYGNNLRKGNEALKQLGEELLRKFGCKILQGFGQG